MVRFAKYDKQSGIDVCYDNSYRFTLKWDAKDALKNRTERLYKDLTKDFDTDYSQNRARLAAQHYKNELDKYGIRVDFNALQNELTSRFWPYCERSFRISLSELRNQSDISKGGSEGLYKYELPMRLIEEYKSLYYRLLSEYYDEIYNYIEATYGRSKLSSW